MNSPNGGWIYDEDADDIMMPLTKMYIYELPYSNLIGSRDAIKNRYLVQGSIDDLLRLDYINYFLNGFLGSWF